jgi:hypothetical protein
MATLRKEIVTQAQAPDVWAAIADIGALHTRLVPGFVTATRLEPGARVVWTVDLLPDEAGAKIEQMMAAGMRAMQKALDSLA